jgi:hypothetical protein
MVQNVVPWATPGHSFFGVSLLEQWYSFHFVHVPTDVISLQLFTPEVNGV